MGAEAGRRYVVRYWRWEKSNCVKREARTAAMANGVSSAVWIDGFID